MKKIINLIKRLTTPRQFTVNDGIAYWQEKVLLNLLLLAACLGLIAYIPSITLSIKEKLWIIAAADTFIYLFLLYLFFSRNLSFTFRAVSISIASYLLGMILTATLGPFGGGPVWLFCFPIITGVLLGYRMAAGALIINALTIIGLGLLIDFNLTDLLALFNINAWYMAAEYPLEKWIVISLNFMLLNLAATLSITTILNGLQRSMTDLAISEKRYRRIFKNIPDIYFETNLSGIILEVSPSVKSIFQYSQTELRGETIENVYEKNDQRDKMFKKLFKNGYVNDHEIRLINKDGTIHFGSLNARLLKDKDGKPERVVGIFRDISEKKSMEEEKLKLEERLNRSQKMETIGILAGGVAHDLNNILSGIVSYPELLAMDLDDDDPLKASLKIIQDSGNRAAEIVQDLLTLSRRGVITREILNLNNLISDFLHTPEYKKILSFHPDIIVEKKIDADRPFVKGSPIHLQKTLMNLISNAAEAQINGGEIFIGTENRLLDKSLKGYDKIQAGNYIVLSVRDKGIGIEPEDLKRIFEPFFTKKTMGRSGTGLGMAVVWGAVQDHDGYIDIISNTNKGTTFDLYFPVNIDESIIEKKRFSLDDYKGNGETILVIEDIDKLRHINSMALNKLGYESVCVSSGEEAIKYLKTNNADLLLLDMIMEPGINGFETYKQILEFKPGQKAIIISGFSQTRQVENTLKLGAGQYIKKPYTLEQIGLAIKTELSKIKNLVAHNDSSR